MEATNGNVMDVDSVGSSDSNNMEQSVEQSKKVELLELPKEILEHILIHLDDKSLLTASHVCKLFAAIAETAFARKYTKKLYCIDGVEEKSFHQVMLNKYGGKMRIIKAGFMEGDEELLDLIEKRCRSLENVELQLVPRMIILKDLKSFSFRSVRNLNKETLIEFINNNQQLEYLYFHDNNLDSIKLLDGHLNNLKTLTYRCEEELTTNLPKIRLNSLETLNLDTTFSLVSVRLLRALECNRLKNLNFWSLYNYTDDNDEVIEAICSFTTLVSLEIRWLPITSSQLKQLADHLPYLTELSIWISETESSTENDILSIVSFFTMLKKLKIYFDSKNYRRFSSDVKKSINDFHARFADTNIEIEIADDYKEDEMVAASKDRIFMKFGNSLEVHWMDDLNETNVRKMMNGIPGEIIEVKFINNCAEHTLDICTLLTKFDIVKCLDIKSNGPVIFKENVSGHHNFFPHLKILKLHLEEHVAIEFLQKLDNSFCERIQELWIDTKSVPEGLETEPEHALDTADILVKFKNLISLNLAPSFSGFNLQYVLSECQHLNRLNVLRHTDEASPRQ